MNILHISNDFANTEVYTQLVSHLHRTGISQTVYSAVRTLVETEFNPPVLRQIPLHLRFILKPKDRLFYNAKIKKIYQDLICTMEVSKIEIVHAHTLYSDGGVALRIKNKYKLPYIIAVRNTDINAFMKYRPDLNATRNKILENASQIVLVSPAYYERLRILLPIDVWENIKTKISIIPNGINPFWLKANKGVIRKYSSKLRLLYVGDFSKNKNINALIEAAQRLESKGGVSLTLVGGGGDHHKQIISMLNSSEYQFVRYLGRIHDLDRLKEVYQENDIFVMTSLKETFGLTYIEALSQGMPIVFTRGEGVDGYFEDGTVGESVDPNDIDDIAAKITTLAERMDSIREQSVEQAKQFSWLFISERYRMLYESILA